ncbi:DUF2125 domain-containing protein [Oricola sp.]|uniref:DUF2125 domain-containing protein n=1 Tax=Oricola sp. TaxID=1979950 RepID=UPI003BAB59A1
METGKAKSGARYSRRIQWLAVAIVLLGVLYSAGWYGVASFARATMLERMADQAGQGTDIDCSDLQVGGYPFRLEVRCSALNVVRLPERIAVRAGALRSAAQVYEPRRIVAELDGPIAIDGAPVRDMKLGWSLARASAVIDEPLPQRASVEIDALTVEGAGTHLLEAGRAEGHMRQRDAVLDLALRYDGLTLAEALTGRRALPPLAGDADISINDGVSLVAGGVSTLRGVSGEMRRAAIMLTPERGLWVSGFFAIGINGLVNADLDLSLADPGGLASALKPAFPELAAQIDVVAALQPPATPGGAAPELKLPLIIRDGVIQVAFFALGRIPPLD